MKAYIIHGWGGSPEINWFPWLKKELEKNGYKVVAPQMPNTDVPTINEWVGHLKEIAKNVDEETVLIGHSIGCQTIMRFLEGDVKVGRVVFVAGFFNLKEETYVEDGEEARAIAKPWLETDIDTSKVKESCNDFTAIFSDNDIYVPLSDSELFKERLGAKIIIEKEKGHFNEETYSVILEETLKFNK